MPNIYATPTEIKAAMPDGIRSTTTTYDNLILELSKRISRLIDGHCGRVFFPKSDTRYFDGDGSTEQWIDDCLEITTLSYSKDDGVNYSAYTSADYYATVAGDHARMESYTKLVANVSWTAAISCFPRGQRSIKLVGIFGYAADRDQVWEDSQDEVESNPLAAGDTSCTVNDADGADLWDVTPRFQVGQLVKIEDEVCEVTGVNTGTNALTLVRGRNGTTAAAHVQNTDITIWRACEQVKQANIIQAIRQMERGFQGFGDARANPDLGEMMFVKQIDPEAAFMLQQVVKARY